MDIAIKTDRLVLRPPEPRDAEAITAYMQVRDLPWNLGRAPYPYKREDAETWIEITQTGWQTGKAFDLLGHASDSGLVGACGIFKRHEAWELGYWVGLPHWGRGYVTEMARALIEWAVKEKGITRFTAGHIDDNPASGRVLRKLGFQYAGVIDLYVRGRDCEVPALRYALGAPLDAALKPFP